jgi:serine/threonine protein kinase
VQLKLNRTVAIKVIHFTKLNQSKEIVRFLGEAEAVAAVDHPHVVRVFESGNANGTPYIAMEYLPGGTLAERLKRHGRIEPRLAAQLLRKIASGVQAAHDQQIIHRDLKPGNILFDAEGEPRVTDFGLAKKRYSGDLTSTQTVMGTPEYMSPEQAMGESKYVGPQADIWALGVIMYEMLTGKRPFEATNKLEAIRLVTQHHQLGMRTIIPSIPQELDLIVAKCLEKDPESRYPSARSLARDLRKWLSGKDIGLVPATPSDRFFDYIERNRSSAIMATMAVIILVCICVIISLKSRIRQLEYGPDGRQRSQSKQDSGSHRRADPRPAVNSDPVGRGS